MVDLQLSVGEFVEVWRDGVKIGDAVVEKVNGDLATLDKLSLAKLDIKKGDILKVKNTVWHGLGRHNAV